MTAQDAFFTREEYFQLLYGALRPEDDPELHGGRLVTLPPTVWKPKPLWTGKQIVRIFWVFEQMIQDNRLVLEFDRSLPS